MRLLFYGFVSLGNLIANNNEIIYLKIKRMTDCLLCFGINDKIIYNECIDIHEELINKKDLLGSKSGFLARPRATMLNAK